MTEPASSIVAVTITASLAAVELMTGISPPLFVWGAIGGYWAFKYVPAMSFSQRTSSVLIAALIAAVGAMPAAVLMVAAARNFLAWYPALLDAALLSKPLAAMIGLMCHRVIGKKLIEVAERAADGVKKS